MWSVVEELELRRPLENHFALARGSTSRAGRCALGGPGVRVVGSTGCPAAVVLGRTPSSNDQNDPQGRPPKQWPHEPDGASDRATGKAPSCHQRWPLTTPRHAHRL